MIGKLYTEDESLYDRMLICSFSPLFIMAVGMYENFYHYFQCVH